MSRLQDRAEAATSEARRLKARARAFEVAADEFLEWFDRRYPGGKDSPAPGVSLFAIAERFRDLKSASTATEGADDGN